MCTTTEKHFDSKKEPPSGIRVTGSISVSPSYIQVSILTIRIPIPVGLVRFQLQVSKSLLFFPSKINRNYVMCMTLCSMCECCMRNVKTKPIAHNKNPKKMSGH